jgi:hypothetical protein
MPRMIPAEGDVLRYAGHKHRVIATVYPDTGDPRVFYTTAGDYARCKPALDQYGHRGTQAWRMFHAQIGEVALDWVEWHDERQEWRLLDK